MERDYSYYKQACDGQVMPFGFVDIDLFDRNIRDIATRARTKSIRIASKSIRSVPLLERIHKANPKFQGIMAYSVREAAFLSYSGFDDILVAYPAVRDVQHSGYFDEVRRGKQIVLMVDSEEHVEFLDKCGHEFDVVVPVCLDLDMATDFPGLHFGVWRSPLRDEDAVARVVQAIKRRDHVRLEGVMGYEAQIAGLPDRVPGKAIKSAAIRMLKRWSIRDVRKRRQAALDVIRNEGIDLSFVNGGGTGSVETTIEERGVTEVTVGSGFFSPVLFDWYAGFHHAPAAGFAIEVTRKPAPNLYTCSGGGYIASGAAGADRLPHPYLPAGAELLPLEGAGEVQTPIQYDGPESIGLGDPIFMRYTKAGEMCERFNVLLVISNGQVIDETPTYRGEGQFFM